MVTSFPSLFKPTLKTQFKVDFEWWKAQDRNWRQSLQSILCAEHQLVFAGFEDQTEFDLVDPVTAEVTNGDALLQTLIEHCAKQPGFLTENSAIVDTIFKVFLANRNQALTCEELARYTGKPADVILRTIGTARVYKGIRPV